MRPEKTLEITIPNFGSWAVGFYYQKDLRTLHIFCPLIHIRHTRLKKKNS